MISFLLRYHKATFVLRKGNCECFNWTYESCSQSFLRVPDSSGTLDKREAFSPKLFSIKGFLGSLVGHKI